jgi:hypothetical protein
MSKLATSRQTLDLVHTVYSSTETHVFFMSWGVPVKKENIFLPEESSPVSLASDCPNQTI